MKTVVGNAELKDDENNCRLPKEQVKALMKARPLSYERRDSRDEPVLTPSHFLVDQLGGKLASDLCGITLSQKPMEVRYSGSDGQDEQVRVVQASTRGHKFTRPINQLCS